MAAKEETASKAEDALEFLCQAYWPPIYAFIRREGHRHEDASDLTQAFFAHILEKEFLDHLHHRQGRFRSFLLTFLKHFLSDERNKARAQKRGGGRPLLSLDDSQAGAMDRLEPRDDLDPEKVFHRRWAQTVLKQAVDRLQSRYRKEGKEALFNSIKQYQPGERGTSSYADISRQLGMSETAIKSAVHRMRKRYRQSLREVIAHTVTSSAEVDDELNYLMDALS